MLARRDLEDRTPEDRRALLCANWARLLGPVECAAAPVVSCHDRRLDGTLMVERMRLEVEEGIALPLLMLRQTQARTAPRPVVVAFTQEGKDGLLRARGEAIAELLSAGAVVCLPDLRGTGESRPGDDRRGREGAATALSSSMLMLGETMLGARLRDLRCVLRYLRTLPEVGPSRLALWGDSLAPAHAPGRELELPLDDPRLPHQTEPLGGLLALFGALFERDVRAVYARGGLVCFQAVLQSRSCCVPHDVGVPGAPTAGGP